MTNEGGAGAAAGFLNFPLRNKTPHTAKIVTVFDHSMDQQYCPDNIVTAYNGEQGKMSFGSSDFFVSFSSCDNRLLHGFKKDNEVGDTIKMGKKNENIVWVALMGRQD